MNHRAGRFVFVLTIALLVGGLSYQWIMNPAGREQLALQLGVLESSRHLIEALVAVRDLEIVDPSSPNRKVGKVYIYPEDEGCSVSGYYRRGEGDRWHPYLMLLEDDHSLISLKIQDRDRELLERAESDSLVEISP